LSNPQVCRFAGARKDKRDKTLYDVEFIVPYKELEGIVKQSFEEFANRDEIHLHVSIMELSAVKKHEFFGEAIIARGLTASFIKNLSLDIPLIEIPMVGYDVFKAVSTGIQKYNPSHIAFIGTPDVIYGAEILQNFFKLKVSALLMQHRDDAYSMVEKAKNEGADLFIGGNHIYQIAGKAAYHAVRIDSGKEAIRQALNEALRAIKIRHQERERTERFRALVEHVHEGIVSIDRWGRITVMNGDAFKMLGLTYTNCTGRLASEVIPEINFSEILSIQEPSFGDLINIKGNSFTTNRIPIKVSGEVVGHLITFQEVAHLQEIESRIRREVHRKGLVARYRFDDVIGESAIIKNTISLARDYSCVGANILIIGETGTGKELFAQGIHANSTRQNGPFVAINCAALPESLLESELFGYVEGAFTGASKGGKTGLFELAHRGTIFLDEVSEITPFLQGRLLRVIEEREIMRLGHDKVMPVDIRVISAANKDLRELVDKGQFRKDLFYRLDVLRLNVPPVRDRGQDIQILIEYFLSKYDTLAHGYSRALDEECWAFLLSRDWEGNVRQIRNFGERLSVIAKGKTISMEDVYQAYGGNSGFNTPVDRGKINDPWADVQALERATILECLRKYGNNKAEAAKALGMDRSTLWRRMKKFGIK